MQRHSLQDLSDHRSFPSTSPSDNSFGALHAVRSTLTVWVLPTFVDGLQAKIANDNEIDTAIRGVDAPGTRALPLHWPRAEFS